MSAILAQFNRDGAPIQAETLEKLVAACPEYGFDGYGIWLQGAVGLAHQHLYSTLPAPPQQQPLYDAAANLAITSDAKLTNRKQLLAKLSLHENDPTASSDAQLILHAYRAWGFDCVTALEGDFAFIIWDGERKELFLARDRLGVRNLVYHLSPQLFIAATDVLHILGSPEIQPAINRRKIAQTLANLFQDQGSSFYENISYLPPASCMRISSENAQQWTYWELAPSERIHYKTDEEYAQHFLNLFKEVLRSRIPEDVPLGISMSGGLDSTSLASMIHQLQQESSTAPPNVMTFSYSFNDCRTCDERAYYLSVIQRNHFDATEVPCDDLWTFRDFQNWPVDKGYLWADPYAWLPRAVIRAAFEKGCQLLTAGYYGDVLFTGQNFWAADMLREYRIADLTRILLKNPGTARQIINSGFRPLIPVSLKRAFRSIFPRKVHRSYPWVHPSLLETVKEAQQEELAALQGKYAAPTLWERINSLTLNIFTQGFPSMQKVYNQSGIEIETPYRDTRLVNFVLSIPTYQLGFPGNDRYILRNAMKGILPEKVRTRRKRTVFMPLMLKGLREKETAHVKQLLTNPLIVREGFIEPNWMQNELDVFLQGEKDEIYELWLAMSLELWLRAVLL